MHWTTKKPMMYRRTCFEHSDFKREGRMNDRSGVYGLLGILVLLGVSVWGINHEPMQVTVEERVPTVEVVTPKLVGPSQTITNPDGTHRHATHGEGALQQWEALTAEVEAYHAKGQPSPFELLQRQQAAFVRVQEQLRREQLALNGELEQMAMKMGR